MSRKSLSNDKFEFVYGLDHLLGPFFQVYPIEAPPATEDIEGDVWDYGPMVESDNRGVRLNRYLRQYISGDMLKRIDQLERQFEAARRQGNEFPNLATDDINDFAKLCGFTGLSGDIYQTLDAPP